MGHPYVELLKDPPLRLLWGGLALSSLGSVLYGVAAVWLATELAGPNAGLMLTANSAAVLVVSLFAGPLVEALPRRWLLIGTELTCAAAALGVVAMAWSTGLSFPVLVAASVVLAAFGAMQRPVLLSSLPALTGGERLRDVNGLFDSTLRAAQAVGPFLAAAAMGVMTALHLLAANAVSFLASAVALALVGRRLDGAARPAAPRGGLLRRLSRGIMAANGCPGAWNVLFATAVRGSAYALGFTVAVPLLFSQSEGRGGLGAVAIVFGAAAAGELITGPLAVLTHPKRPLRRQFEGYILIGASLALVGAASALPVGWQMPAMAACAFLMGVGGSVAHIQLTTFFGVKLSADDYAAVLRLRLIMVIGAMMATTAIGPLVLPAFGTALTTITCGLVATAVALVGAFSAPARRLGPGFVEFGTGEDAPKLVS